MQKEKNLAKMTKIFNQVEAEREAERKKQEQADDRKLAELEAQVNKIAQDVNNIVSEVKKGAQNLVSNFQRGMNRKSAKFTQSFRNKKKHEPDVRYKTLNNESGASAPTVAISMANSPPRNELEPAMPLQENTLHHGCVDLIVPTEMITNGTTYQATSDDQGSNDQFARDPLSFENNQNEFPVSSQMSTEIDETNNVESLEKGEREEELTHDQKLEKLSKMRQTNSSLEEKTQQITTDHHRLLIGSLDLQGVKRNLKKI